MPMTPRSPKETLVIYKDKDKNEYKGEVVEAERVEGADFFRYTVKLFAKEVQTG